jgi:3-hydroxyisobutyrate dehydrogenase
MSLDAPVSGGDVGAKAATLSIMCGGSDEAFSAARPWLNLLGKNIVHMGGPGAGQHTKMCNQILICSNMIGMTESLVYARRAGLDVEAVIKAIGAGAAGSWAVNNLGPRVARRDFAPGFMIEHMAKDLGIALAESERLGLRLPGLTLARRLYDALLRHGHGKDGTQALVLAIEDAARYDDEAEIG